ncbi:unnamed protein product, partial [Didymodactylos carnosus]
SDLFPYNPLDSAWIIVYTLPSFVFFIIIHGFITKYGFKQVEISKTIEETVLIDEKIVHSSPTKQQIRWIHQNTFLSFVHSTLCGLLLFIAFYRAPEILKDPLSHANIFNYRLLCFSLGYFFYDMFDCLLYAPKQDLSYAIIGHHIIVIIYILNSLIQTRNIGYTMFALSMEINSIFLHARRLLN